MTTIKIYIILFLLFVISIFYLQKKETFINQNKLKKISNNTKLYKLSDVSIKKYIEYIDLIDKIEEKKNKLENIDLHLKNNKKKNIELQPFNENDYNVFKI